MTRIYVIRHGQSYANILARRIHRVNTTKWGVGESPLTKLGREQSKSLARELASVPFTALYSSPLTRAVQTAKYIAKPHNLPVTVAPMTHERDWGEMWRKMSQKNKDEWNRYLATLTDEEHMNVRIFSDMETANEAIDRFQLFIDALIKKHPGETIALVNHAANMRYFLIRIGWATYAHLGPGTVKNCSYFVLESEGGYHISHTHLIKSSH